MNKPHDYKHDGLDGWICQKCGHLQTIPDTPCEGSEALPNPTTPGVSKPYAANSNPDDPANPELGYQSLAEILTDNAVTGYHRKHGQHNTSLIEDLEQFITQREAQAFNAGIEAALGAIPEPRVFDHGFNDASHYYKEALDQARAAIERKRK